MASTASGNYIMKEIVFIKKQGPAFEPPKKLRNPSFYQQGMGEKAFNVKESQQPILSAMIAAGCIKN